MLCKTPYVRDPSGKVIRRVFTSAEAFKSEDIAKDLMLSGYTFPCGQCLACRINKRRVWTHRLMLEGFCHPDSMFVTLTYAPEHYPGQLVKRDAQLFIKRLRKALEPRKIRYYLAGEYGEKKSRAHYHAILFGVYRHEKKVIERCWPFGLVDCGDGNRLTFQYVAGYVTKKYIKKEDGLQKEFTLMSRKPGIGYPALSNVLRLMDNPHFVRMLHLQGDVPHGLHHGSKFMPFGRYLTDKLRDMMDVGYTSDSFYADIRSKYLECFVNDKTFLERYQDETRQQLLNLEAKERLWQKRRYYHGA